MGIIFIGTEKWEKKTDMFFFHLILSFTASAPAPSLYKFCSLASQKAQSDPYGAQGPPSYYRGSSSVLRQTHSSSWHLQHHHPYYRSLGTHYLGLTFHNIITILQTFPLLIIPCHTTALPCLLSFIRFPNPHATPVFLIRLGIKYSPHLAWTELKLTMNSALEHLVRLEQIFRVYSIHYSSN